MGSINSVFYPIDKHAAVSSLLFVLFGASECYDDGTDGSGGGKELQ